MGSEFRAHLARRFNTVVERCGKFKVQDFLFRILCSGFRVQGPGFRVQGAGCRLQGAEFRVQGPGLKVQGVRAGRRL